MKLSRFLIADDPMNNGAPSAIIHTQSPQAIIEIIEGHIDTQSPHLHYQFEDELFTLRVHHLFTDNFDSEQHHIIITKLLNSAWDWFVKYMEWEDEQDDV